MIPGIVAGYPVTPAPPPSGWNTAVAALSGLWGWWKLDEAAGAAIQATDASGNGRHGTYTAAGSQTTGLFSGSVASQASLGGQVTLPSYTTPATPQFTVGAMIRTTSASGDRQVMSADASGTNRAWQFRMNSAGLLQFLVIRPSVVTLTGATAVNDGNPHLVIATFDQSLGAGVHRMSIYLDGALLAQGGIGTTVTSGQSAAIGIGSRYGGASTDLWAGAMDECFFCDDAISAGAVAALWAARNS